MTLSLLHATAELEELIDPSAELRQIASGFHFTEGPAWDRVDGCLLFSDLRNDTRWRWSEARGAEIVMRPNFKANGMVFEADGSLLVCEHVTSSVVRIRRNGDRQIVAFHYRGSYLNSPNDVVTRSDGSIYFTDPNYGRWRHAVGIERECELPFQGVFRVPPGSGEVELVVDESEFEQPNGLCFSPDETTLYVDDLDGVKAFDVAPDGSLSRCRVFRDRMGSNDPLVEGGPDGMKCDERGNVWCTGRGGVWVIAPTGKLLGIVETPEIVANLAWGGEDRRSLFLCTSTTVHVVETRVASAALPYHS